MIKYYLNFKINKEDVFSLDFYYDHDLSKDEILQLIQNASKKYKDDLEKRLSHDYMYTDFLKRILSKEYGFIFNTGLNIYDYELDNVEI